MCLREADLRRTAPYGFCVRNSLESPFQERETCPNVTGITRSGFSGPLLPVWAWGVQRGTTARHETTPRVDNAGSGQRPDTHRMLRSWARGVQRAEGPLHYFSFPLCERGTQGDWPRGEGGRWMQPPARGRRVSFLSTRHNGAFYARGVQRGEALLRLRLFSREWGTKGVENDCRYRDAPSIGGGPGL